MSVASPITVPKVTSGLLRVDVRLTVYSQDDVKLADCATVLLVKRMITESPLLVQPCGCGAKAALIEPVSFTTRFVSVPIQPNASVIVAEYEPAGKFVPVVPLDHLMV